MNSIMLKSFPLAKISYSVLDASADIFESLSTSFIVFDQICSLDKSTGKQGHKRSINAQDMSYVCSIPEQTSHTRNKKTANTDTQI